MLVITHICLATCITCTTTATMYYLYYLHKHRDLEIPTNKCIGEIKRGITGIK